MFRVFQPNEDVGNLNSEDIDSIFDHYKSQYVAGEVKFHHGNVLTDKRFRAELPPDLLRQSR